MLKEHPQVTALFCINDDVANEALRAVKDMGLSVPKDVSIIGYDDTYTSLNAHPSITTMHVDTITMGRAAVQLLSLRIDNLESTQMTLTIRPNLVERESVGSVE